MIKLDASDAKSPLVVMQEGYVSNDPHSRMRMFYLQRDSMWIDEVASSTLPESETRDIVFDTTGEARASSGSPEQLFRNFLARYRAAKG